MDLFKYDYRRMTGKEWSAVGGFLRTIKNHQLWFAYWGRKKSKIKIIDAFYKFVTSRIGNKHGIEINYKNIGRGLSLVHAFDITINPHATVGNDVTIFKGATIGSVVSGRNKGAPTIGDRVTICTNAFICGNVKIGNDVLIAANAFVNFDVPDNSVVIGNPGFIKHKENPSKDYLR